MLVHARVLLGHLPAHPQQPLDRLLDVRRPRHEVLDALLLLGRVRRDPLVLGVVALGEVGDEDERAAQVLRQPVRALERLAAEAEDVVDVNDGASGISRAGDVCERNVSLLSKIA